MAFIRERDLPAGRRYLVAWRDEHGKERTKTFTSKKEARYFRNQLDNDRADGVHVPDYLGKSSTFSQVADAWLVSRSLRPSSLDRDESYLRSLIRPRIGHLPIGEVTTGKVRDLSGELIRTQYRQGHTYAPATVNKAVAIVREVVDYAIDDGLLPAPAAIGKVKGAPKVTGSADRQELLDIPTVAQMAEMIDHADGNGVRFWGAHLAFLAGTGLRWGEFAGMMMDCVDLEAGVVRVRRQLARRGGGLELVDNLKTREARREVTLPGPVLERTREHIARFGVHEGRLFSTLAGARLDGSNFRPRVLKPAGAAARVPRVRIHDLRHHHASVLLETGTPIHHVARRLGHRDATVTLSVYAHVIDDLADDSAATAYAHAIGAHADSTADSPGLAEVVAFRR
ncbi:MAG: site-specific integrase [Acidimicrobiaceae bacterium]|nr:site-specific integrase [Acidimicrobiaceae bacterium]MBT5580570.1 site-specific integrase [Acidimicrobiaceae bacterium]MBT5849927.1 site-specific integrase [Acidimicrobiaceae bacterium]